MCYMCVHYFFLLYYCNNQLPLSIIIAVPVLSFPFSPLLAVFVSFTYTDMIDAPSLSLVQHPFRFNAPKPPPASAPPVHIKYKAADLLYDALASDL